jgi:hypothetical protein
MPKVYIINDSGHDYSEAKQFGTLVFLTKGKVASYATTQHYRVFAEKMKDAGPNDFILVTSLASMNCIAGWIMGTLGFPLNLLLFKDDKYVVRRIVPRLVEPSYFTTDKEEQE